MEHLTKSQIVLLCLFVSFVSSMATGIVTVTLMQQAPEPIMQSITNVVEKTIEKVTPTIVEKPGKTVVVKDEDLLVAAIASNTQSTVAFREAGEAGTSAGVGFIISSDGLVVTDKGNIGGSTLTTVVGTTKYNLEILSMTDESSSFVLGRLVPAVPLESGAEAPVFVPIVFGNVDALKVGQTAIVIGGRDGKTVSTGLVNAIETRTTTDKETKVETTTVSNISISQRLGATSNGAPVITLDGSVVALLSIDEAVGSQTGIPAPLIQKLLADYQASLKKAEQKSR